jgi:hypothetical protein
MGQRYEFVAFGPKISAIELALATGWSTMCPLGYKEYDGAPRATFADTCEPCQPGTFGAHVSRAVCEETVPCIILCECL